jgi:hypothetical protein
MRYLNKIASADEAEQASKDEVLVAHAAASPPLSRRKAIT